MITEGRVKLRGKVVTELGTKADPEKDSIKVDGKVISIAGPRKYILLNKPQGYISAASDPGKRPVVTDLIKKVRVRLYPIGRLDFDAEGVLILTNDGEMTNRLIHPKYKVEKRYLAKVKGVPSEKAIARLRAGVRLEDGKTLPAKASLTRKTKENSWVDLTVTEGRNHLIKRMCMAVGHPVLRIKRTEFAGLGLSGLKPGESRPLTSKELKKIRKVAGL